MRVLVKFDMDCGRMGDIDGLFITTEKELNAAYGERAYFGEVLGKHSDIEGLLHEHQFEIVSRNQSFIDELRECSHSNTICGLNPMSYLED